MKPTPMTYAELSALWGVSRDAARKRVKALGLTAEPGEDGKLRVTIDLEDAPGAEKPAKTPGDTPVEKPAPRPARKASEAKTGATRAETEALQAHVRTLLAEVERLTTLAAGNRADFERERAKAEALAADLADLHERLLAAEGQYAQRSIELCRALDELEDARERLAAWEALPAWRRAVAEPRRANGVGLRIAALALAGCGGALVASLLGWTAPSGPTAERVLAERPSAERSVAERTVADRMIALPKAPARPGLNLRAAAEEPAQPAPMSDRASSSAGTPLLHAAEPAASLPPETALAGAAGEGNPAAPALPAEGRGASGPGNPPAPASLPEPATAMGGPYLPVEIAEPAPPGPAAALSSDRPTLPPADSRDPAPQDLAPQAAEPAMAELAAAEPADADPADAEPTAAESVEADAGPPRFAGLWAVNAAGCTPRAVRRAYLLTVIGPQGAWAGETSCAFKSSRWDGNAWLMAATCSDSRKSWKSQVRLVVDGDRLTWRSRKGLRTYVRCEEAPIFAERPAAKRTPLALAR
jgi:hypothetical protein